MKERLSYLAYDIIIFIDRQYYLDISLFSFLDFRRREVGRCFGKRGNHQLVRTTNLVGFLHCGDSGICRCMRALIYFEYRLLLNSFSSLCHISSSSVVLLHQKCSLSSIMTLKEDVGLLVGDRLDVVFEMLYSNFKIPENGSQLNNLGEIFDFCLLFFQ